MLNNKHIRDVARLSIIVVLSLVACAQQTLVSPLATPERVLPTLIPPTATHTITPSPTSTATATSTPYPTATLTLPPTPTSPPYTDAPFKLVYWHDNDVWVSVLGGNMETRYITSMPDWQIGEYAMAPTCDKLLYTIGLNLTNHDRRIKLLDFEYGVISDLDDDSNPYFEARLIWIDEHHIAYEPYTYSEIIAKGPGKITPDPLEYDPFALYQFNLDGSDGTLLGQFLDFSQSPNGRYQLRDSGEGCESVLCVPEHFLRDLRTGEYWQVAPSATYGHFMDWSPDSKWMSFRTSHPDRPDTSQLIIVNVEERSEQFITPEDKVVIAAAWSPDSRSLAYILCEYDACTLQVYELEMDETQEIFGYFQFRHLDFLAWSPDGKRLVFVKADTPGLVWSIRLDGTDLRPILEDAGMIAVCEP